MPSLTIPRLDLLLTLYLCSPVAKVFGRAKNSYVPVLTYHSISNNLFGHSHPYFQINTSPEVFSEQMRWLKCAGYESIGLTEMWRQVSAGQDMSKKVVITFDDGYRDFYTDAYSIMKQCGFSATVFLATGRIRNVAMRYEGVDYLTWNDIRELHAGGIQFGSHTVTHPDLRSMEPEQIDYELGCSKETIEQELGSTVESFSYPFPFPEEDKDFTRFLGDTLENLGFKNGVCSVIGRASRKSNPFFIPRMPLNSGDNVELLQAKLSGGYDWMHFPQWLHKLVHHNVSLMQAAGKRPTSSF